MADNTEVPLSQLGPFSRLAHVAMEIAQVISPMALIGRFVPILKGQDRVTAAEGADESFAIRRAIAIEWYIFACVVLEATIVTMVLRRVILPDPVRWVVYLLMALRIIEILMKAFSVTIFDRMGRRTDDTLISAPRMVFLAFVSFGELAACFGTVYALDLHMLQGADEIITAYYFSMITQLTIGYGDVVPTGYLRLIAAIHGGVAVAFFTLVFARLMTALPSLGRKG